MERDRLIYFHPDKFNGFGATSIDRWPDRLEEQGLDVSKGRIVEGGLTIEEATRREIELQVENGYPTDNNLYSSMIQRGIKASSPDIRRKAGISISKAKKGTIPPQNLNKEWYKWRYKAIQQYSLDGKYIKQWDSAKQAGEALGIRNAGITKVCNDNYPYCKTYKGYVWKYVQVNPRISQQIKSETV